MQPRQIVRQAGGLAGDVLGMQQRGIEGSRGVAAREAVGFEADRRPARFDLAVVCEILGTDYRPCPNAVTLEDVAKFLELRRMEAINA